MASDSVRAIRVAAVMLLSSGTDCVSTIDLHSSEDHKGGETRKEKERRKKKTVSRVCVRTREAPSGDAAKPEACVEGQRAPFPFPSLSSLFGTGVRPPPHFITSDVNQVNATFSPCLCVVDSVV